MIRDHIQIPNYLKETCYVLQQHENDLSGVTSKETNVTKVKAAQDDFSEEVEGNLPFLTILSRPHHLLSPYYIH